MPAHVHSFSCLKKTPKGRLVCIHEKKSAARKPQATPAAGTFTRSNRVSTRPPHDPGRSVIPPGRGGSYATIEDGKVVVHEIRLGDFGCEQDIRRETSIRAYSAGLDPKQFPRAATWSISRQAFTLSLDGPMGTREVEIPEHSMEKISSVRTALPESKIGQQYIGRRFTALEEAVRERGGRVLRFHLPIGRLTGALKKIFEEWGRAVISGVLADDNDLWDRLYKGRASDEVNRVNAMVLGGIRAVPRVGPLDLLALYKASPSKTGYFELPEVMVGEVPTLDWCNPIRRGA